MCDSQSSFKSVKEKNNTDIQTNNISLRNISKAQIKETSCLRCCSSAPCVAETTRDESSRWENITSVQKITSEPIKLEYICDQNYREEEKDIGVQTNSAQNFATLKKQKQTKPECIQCQINNKWQINDTKEGIDDQTNSSQYATSKDQKQSKLQKCVDCHEDKLNDLEYIKIQIKDEVPKNIAVQTNSFQYLTTEDQKQSKLQFVDCQNNNKDKKLAVETDPISINQERVNKQIKDKMEKNIVVQTEYIPFAKEYIEEDKEIAIQTDPTPINSDCMKKQIKYEEEKNVGVQSKYIQPKKFYKGKIYKPYIRNQNNNKRGENIAECMKRQKKIEEEKDIGVQAKYIQYRNISKEQIDKPYVRNQNYNKEEKECAIQPRSTLIGAECLKRQNKINEDIDIGVQAKYIQYRNISKEPIDVIQPRPTLTDTECMERQNKIYEEKDIGVQAKYIHYRNISKAQTDDPYVKNHNYNKEREYSIRPYPPLIGLECMKRQNKYEGGVNIEVQGKYVHHKNLLKDQIDEPYADNKNYNLEKNIFEPYCFKRNLKYETDKDTAVQTKYMQYKNLSKEKFDSEPYIMTQNNEEENNQPNSVQYKYVTTETDNDKCNNNCKGEKENVALGQYINIERSNENINITNPLQNEQIQTVNQDNRNNNKINKLKFDKIDDEQKKIVHGTNKTFTNTSNKNCPKKIKIFSFDNIYDDRKDINEINKAHTCNKKCSNYITLEDFSKPKNFKHLFTRKNIGNNSQYIKNDETHQGCSIKCSKYIPAVDYTKPERFTHLISTPKLCNSQYSKSVETSDGYSRKDFTPQYSKRIHSKGSSAEQCTFKVVRKKSVSDNYCLAVKQRKIKDINNASTVYGCTKKFLENQSIFKKVTCSKTDLQRSKACKKSSATSIYAFLKNMFMKN